jgi:hypothetical protein
MPERILDMSDRFCKEMEDVGRMFRCTIRDKTIFEYREDRRQERTIGWRNMVEG